MDLWTEFEGVTIDSAFALNKLLQSEGRSAFFSTSNAQGESVLIRIIECHFDEDEILARWRGVETLGHPNFLHIDRFGQFLIEADEITAVYAVFERVDANLGQVLEQGHLSPAEATQIGLSMTSALETLHTHGFVHEHVEASNIFAVGESVKLRSDCIRETPEGEAGLKARRRDVHDLSLVLMQVLLGLPLPSHKWRQPSLPAPFEQIVRKGMSGEWGLAEIKAALTPVAKPAPAPVEKAAPAVAETVKPSEPEVKRMVDAAAPPLVPASASSRPEPRPATAAMEDGKPAVRKAVPIHEPAHNELPLFGPISPEVRKWGGVGIFVLLLVIVGWSLMHRWFGHSNDAAAHKAVAGHTAAVASHAAPAAAPRPTRSGAVQATPSTAASTHGKTEWRVVAFTYNREDQARKKASTLAQRHPDLQPQAFSPTGRAPWLVTVGGPLERDAAYAMARKAASLGLPRDTYAQNYTAR